MAVPILNDWKEILSKEFEKEYYKNLTAFLENEYSLAKIYPNKTDIFNALKYTAYEDVKVVILGQDPYHGLGQAHGLCFSVNQGVKIPPSLMNIFKELNSDLNCYIPDNGYLKKWAEQGVLLLNTILTVRENEAASHSKVGWEKFTDNIIKELNKREDSIIFILWGNYSKSKKGLITNKRHYIIESAHPSPFSASKGFFGTKPFSTANNFLQEQGKKPIEWQIESICL